ncbi:MAG: phosphatase PAP2 family protein [Phycisphaeraceae bacterium]|nr:MAG: phosphatase PAP2 family protein [Phycisphaeraceae bacterium]
MTRKDPVRMLPPFPWLRAVVLPLAITLPLTILCLFLDKPLSEYLRSVSPRGDIRRELETIQQFGSVTTILLVFILIALLQRDRLRRMLDWIFAALVGGLIFNGLKLLIGRGRPALDDPWLFQGPGPAIEQGINYSAMSMPSTHTTHAVIGAVFLSAFDRRLSPLVWTLVALVMFARITLGAHWPSDTILGLGLGLAWANLCIHRYWGVRSLDAVWKLFVPRASPKFQEVYERERRNRHTFIAGRTP